MKRMTAVALGLLMLVAQSSARADIALLVTTDNDLSDNGGVDQFTPIAPGGSATVYIWGIATPSSASVGEFNFDVNNSGSSLSFSNASIGSVFSGVGGSISETDLNDLQFGWSKFFGSPVSIPTGSYTLYATVDVAVAAGATPGPDTTIDVAGPDFTMKDGALAAITTTATARDIAQDGTPSCPDGSSCDDGDACTTGDTCGGGACAGGPPLSCDDGNTCTNDSCDPTAGCQHTDNTDPCDDGNACTVSDTCSTGSCVGGPPLSCDDGNLCTDDSCDPAVGCQQVNNTNLCDDGNACTTSDTCSAGACVGGSPPNCDDDNVCTDDSCDPALGCKSVGNTAVCDDGDACTTSDTCSDGACVGGSPPNCDDGW